MSKYRNIVNAMIAGQLAEFREEVRDELYQRIYEEVESRRICVQQEMFLDESGESPREAIFRKMHSVDKMDQPFDFEEYDSEGKPNAVEKGPKRPADGDCEGNPKLSDGETGNPWK